MARRDIGPMSITLDVRDQLQREMLIGNYEVETEAIIREILRPGDTYVDIGTQLGYTAAIAADVIGPKGRLVLFEPDPVALERLENHLAEARKMASMPRVDLVRAACSDQPGVLRFHVSPILGHSRVLRDGEEVSTGRVIEVPVKRADDLLQELGVGAIRFMKIDTEGHELAVLQGLQKTLSAGMVETIHIEKNQDLFDIPSKESTVLHALIARHRMQALHEE